MQVLAGSLHSVSRKHWCMILAQIHVALQRRSVVDAAVAGFFVLFCVSTCVRESTVGAAGEIPRRMSRDAPHCFFSIFRRGARLTRLRPCRALPAARGAAGSSGRCRIIAFCSSIVPPGRGNGGERRCLGTGTAAAGVFVEFMRHAARDALAEVVRRRRRHVRERGELVAHARHALEDRANDLQLRGCRHVLSSVPFFRLVRSTWQRQKRKSNVDLTVWKIKPASNGRMSVAC